MFNVVTDINPIAIVAATVACTILGGVWFAALVPKQYATALGRDPDVKPVMSLLGIAGPCVCTLLTVLASAVLLQALKVDSIGDALVFGAIVGVGLLVATMTNVAINPNFPRPLNYAAVNAPYFLLSSLLISSILVTMR
jgi:hypothetical protein